MEHSAETGGVVCGGRIAKAGLAVVVVVGGAVVVVVVRAVVVVVLLSKKCLVEMTLLVGVVDGD
jgi:hypothetical protein